MKAVKSTDSNEILISVFIIALFNFPKFSAIVAELLYRVCDFNIVASNVYLIAKIVTIKNPNNRD